LLAGNGAEAKAYASPFLNTFVAGGTNTSIKAGGGFNLISRANNKSLASSEAVIVFSGLAAGTSIAEANNMGVNFAHVDGASVTALDVAIVAETQDYAKAHSLAGAGALLASGVGADSEALVISTTQAFLGSGTNIRAYNSFLLSADETPEALADSKGISVGGLGLAVGVSFSDAQTRPFVRSFISPNSNIVTGIFATGNPTITLRSEAELMPVLGAQLNFVPGTVTQVPHTITVGGFWGIPSTTLTYYTYEITGAKITRDDTASGGSWLDDGFAPGQTIQLSGATANRGSYKIKDVTADTMTLEDGYQLAPENAVPSASVFMTTDLPDSIHRDSGSWLDDGFRAGHAIRVSGSNNNDGVYRIQSISADGRTLQLTTQGDLSNETLSGVDVSVAPEVSMVGNPSLKFDTEAYFLGGANLTFAPDTVNPDEGTITRDSGKWIGEGFLPGYRITVYGSNDNDGEYDVLNMNDDILTVKRVDGNDLVDEQNITPVIRQELPDTITRDSGSWTADGFLAGQRIRITNSLLNDGIFRIQSISPDGTVLTLDADVDGDGTADDLNQLTNDPYDTDVTITAVGEGIGGLAGDLTVIAVQSLPASGVSAKADGSASSGSLLLSGSGTENQAINNSSVYAYVGSGTTLRFTGNADVNASTFATQRTASDGFSVGALAGGASLADANAISDTQAYLETLVSVTGGNLRVFAGGVDDSEAWAEVGTGGIIAGGDAEASTNTISMARAYLAPVTGGQPSPFNVLSLEVQADHTARFDSVAVSTHAQLAGASLSEAVNHAVSSVEASIGDDLVIDAEEILVEAIGRTDKPLRRGDRANLRGSSGGLADLPVSNISYTQFENNTLAKVGDRVQLTALSGDRDKPGRIALYAYNDIEAWDYVVLDSGGVVAIPVGFSIINGEQNNATVQVGQQAALQSDGDIDLSSRTDGWLHSQTQVSTYGLAGAGWGGSGALLDADNRVTVMDGATFQAGRHVYLLAGTERMGHINDFDLTAKTDIWNNTLVPLGPLGAGIANALPGPTPRAETLMRGILNAAGLEVPADANLNLSNQVIVEPNVVMTSIGDAYFYAEEGDVEVDGDGNAKDLYSEILGALSGGALEWGGGRSIFNSVSGVQMDGSVEVGIQNKWYLGLFEHPSSTFDSPNSYIIAENTIGDPEVSYIPYIVREESLLLNLVEALEKAQALRAQYDDYNPANVTPEEAAFDAEIARLESEIAAMGFSTTETFDGTLTFATLSDGDPSSQEKQTISHNGTKGAFSLSFKGDTTTLLYNNATKDDVESALNALSSINTAGGVTVTGSGTAGDPWVITFNGSGDQEQIIAQAAVGPTVIEKQNVVRFIVVDPVVAQSANVNVKGDYLIGTGTLKARGETDITIINDTQYYLRANDLIIPEEEGGYIRFNNGEVAAPSDIQNRNQKVPSQATQSLTIQPGTIPGTTPNPSISVTNSKGSKTIGGITMPAPDIELVGDVRNLMGTLTVSSQGGIIASGAIQAGTINLGAAGKFVLSYVDELVSVGGDPKNAYSTVVWAHEIWKTDKKDLTGSPKAYGLYYESLAQQQLAIQSQTGGFIFGDNVFISARYLNINGTIQSGRPFQTLILPESLDTTIANLRTQYESELNSGLNPDPRIYLNPWLPPTPDGLNSPVRAFYNYDSDWIELDPIVVKGGYIELVGEIMSTGYGKIQVRDGFGDIDVENKTGYDLLVPEVDVGSGAEGKLVITDLAASRLNPAALRTEFKGDGSSVQITMNRDDGQATSPIGVWIG
jgi:hypothetical protein